LNLVKCKLLAAGWSVVPGLFPAEVNVVQEVELLKSPIGGTAFCEGRASARVADLQGGLDRLAGMADAHVAYKILAACCGAGKAMWLARTTPPSSIMQALRSFDSKVRLTFESIIGTALVGSEWTQATLGPASGGMGLREISSHACAAYVASRASSFDLCSQADGAFRWEGEDPLSPLGMALAVTQAQFLPGVSLLADAFGPVPPHAKQRALSKAIDARILHDLLASLPEHGQARIRSCSAPQAAAWVHHPRASSSTSPRPTFRQRCVCG
jgi:hypothetical protein